MYDSLYGLKPEDYQHPGEKIAMAALKKIPLLDIITTKYIDMYMQFDMYAEAVGNYYRITEKTNPRVYSLYKLALSRLGMTEEYPLFSKMGYDYNAFTGGVKKPFIILHSSIISNYSDEELLYVIGHEIGHIKSGHLLYCSMMMVLNSLLGSFGEIALAASVGLNYALLEWRRNSEYTADRASLIAAGNIDYVNKGIMKLLGQTDNVRDIDFSVEKVIKQAEDLKADAEDVIGKLLYVNFTMAQTHPWSILRLKQINDWYNSGEYEKVVGMYR